MRYGYGRNQKKGIIGLSNFIGYNSVDDPSNLPLGYLVTGSKNIDISRSRGGLPKVMGRTALFTSLGSGAIKGLFNYRHSSGDIPLFGWGTALYKVSGTEYTITETTTANFADGTASHITTTGDKLALEEYEYFKDTRTTIETPANGWADTGDYLWGKTLSNPAKDFYLELDLGGVSESLQYNDYYRLKDAGGNVLAYIRVRDTSDTSATRTYYYYLAGVEKYSGTSATDKTPKLIREGSIWSFYLDDNLIYTSSGATTEVNSIEIEDSAYGLRLTTLEFAGMGDYASGTWLSEVYDLTNIPKTATIAWNTDSVEDTAINIYARGSSDGTIWGDWETIAASGNSIPRKRYIQIKVEINPNEIIASSLTDYTVTFTLAYDTSASLHTGLSGNKVRFCDYEGTCYIADGGRPHKYDGTTVYNVGIDAPDSAPTVAASATAGTPNGTYYCKVTFINDYGAESNASVASSSVSPSSKKIDWSNIPTGAAGSGVTGRKLYRTKAGGASDGDYYFVASIADNTTTTYTDDTADSALITELDIDNDIPPNSSIVLEHKNYMMYVADNLLYFSKVTLPDSVPPDNYKQFPDDITGIRTYQNYLAVQGRTFSAVVYGDIWGGASDNTDIKILNKSVGAVNHEAMAECYGSGIADILVFPTEAGVSYFDLGVQEQSVRTSPMSEEVQNIFDEAVNKENMAAIYNNYLYMVALDYYTATDTPTSANNIIMTYDLRRKKWYPPITYGVSCFCIADGLLLSGDSSLGIIYQLNSGTTDAGSNIHAIAVTSVINPQGNSYKSKFTRLRLKVDDDSITDSLQIKPSIDGEEGTIDIDSTLIWQTETLSPYYRIPLPRGNEIQLTVEDNSTNDWVISSINIEYEGGEL